MFLFFGMPTLVTSLASNIHAFRIADLHSNYIVCGTQDFSSSLKGYENIRVVCPRCHNHNVIARKRRQFFTFCFIPIVPISWGEELRCTICGYNQETNQQQLDGMQQQQVQGQQGQMMNPSMFK